MTTTASSLFRDRFSCRAFTPEPISRSTLVGLVDAARWAPTGGNAQPWRFVVVSGIERKRGLVAAALGQSFIAQAPVVVVVCALPELSARLYGDRGRILYAIQDTAAATQNLLLAATLAGLGTCWVGAFHEERVARALDLPPDWRPVALVPIGHPAESATKRSRRSLQEVMVWLED